VRGPGRQGRERPDRDHGLLVGLAPGRRRRLVSEFVEPRPDEHRSGARAPVGLEGHGGFPLPDGMGSTAATVKTDPCSGYRWGRYRRWAGLAGGLGLVGTLGSMVGARFASTGPATVRVTRIQEPANAARPDGPGRSSARDGPRPRERVPEGRVRTPSRRPRRAGSGP